jgi:hypothetical protein
MEGDIGKCGGGGSVTPVGVEGMNPLDFLVVASVQELRSRFLGLFVLI